MRMTFRLFAAAVGILSASLAAHADTITIDFNGAGANGSPFTSYSEHGYTVSNQYGNFGVSTSLGFPEPAITLGGTGGLRIESAGDSEFTLDSVVLHSSVPGAVSYTLWAEGPAGLYSVTDGDPSSAFTTVVLNEGPSSLFELDFIENVPGTVVTIDNIVLSTDASSASPAPEPSSFLMLGTGLLGVVGMMRKRFA